MNAVINQYFTYYSTAFAPDPYPDLMDIERLHEVVRSGSLHTPDDIRTTVEILRKTQDSGFKRRLPFMMITGRFGRNHSRQSFVPESATGYLVLDFDHVPVEQLARMRIQFQRHSFVQLIFLSPSGHGLKVIIRTQVDAAQHQALYFAVSKLLAEGNPAFEADPQASGFFHGCFMSWDPESYFNPMAEIITATATSELIARFPVVSLTEPVKAKASSIDYTSLLEQDFVDLEEEQLDCSTLPNLIRSFLAQLELHYVRWASGGRHEFLFNLVQLKRYSVTFTDLWPHLQKHIDGQWTPERTEAKTKAHLEGLFRNYLRVYDLKQTDKLLDTLSITQYLSEKLDVVADHLQRHKRLYVNAPTGAWKTSLVRALTEQLGVYADLLMPTRTLVQQQRGEGTATILGHKPLEAKHRQAAVLAACYQSIGKLAERGAQLLVLDEAHTLVSDYSWKSEVIQSLALALPRYEYVLFLSGSMFPLQSAALGGQHLRIAPANRFTYEYNLVKLAPDVEERDYFLNTLRPGALNVWYLNDKATLKKVEQLLKRKGLRVLLFTRDELDTAENEEIQIAHQSLINQAHLVECDVL